MNKLDWKTTVEIVGMTAIVVSLIFVGLELQQTRAIAQADRQFQQVERELGVTDLISEHSALVVKINDGEQLTDAENLVADHLVRSVALSYFFSWSQANLLDGARGPSIRGLAIFLIDNPGLKARYFAQMERNEAAEMLVDGEGLRGNSKAFYDEVVEYLSILEGAVGGERR